MPLPRPSLLIAILVVALLAVIGALLGIGKPVGQIRDRIADRDAALKAQALEAQKGRDAWRNGTVPAVTDVPFQSRP